MTARLTTPAGFKVVRVDMQSERVVNFAVNKITGPASKLPHAGFERPAHCEFGPDGTLYVVDWGELEIHQSAAESACNRVQVPSGESGGVAPPGRGTYGASDSPLPRRTVCWDCCSCRSRRGVARLGPPPLDQA
jgi:hypothetical protein